MILVAESGATKVHWALVDVEKGLVGECRTKGINVVLTDTETVASIVREAIEGLSVADGCESLATEVSCIYFYAAGLVSDRPEPGLEAVLHSCFPHACVEFGSDMLAAARALWADRPGIVSILGTGSNTGFYDGSSVSFNVRSGGFILGDEGSGAVFARDFLADYFKNIVPEGLAEAFRDKFGITYDVVVRSVYRGEAPSRYLASFVPFILEHMENEYVGALVCSNFKSYIERSVLAYDVASYDVGIAGTFGWMCEDVLRRMGREYGVRFTGFVKNPIDRLIPYHISKLK